MAHLNSSSEPTSQPALVLFAHGSRDPRWAEPLHKIRDTICAQTDMVFQVQLAFLEMMSPTLPDLVKVLSAQQVRTIHVIPIFLGQGGHVRNDLRDLFAQLTTDFPQIRFSHAPAIGEHPDVLAAIAAACIDSWRHAGSASG